MYHQKVFELPPQFFRRERCKGRRSRWRDLEPIQILCQHHYLCANLQEALSQSNLRHWLTSRSWLRGTGPEGSGKRIGGEIAPSLTPSHIHLSPSLPSPTPPERAACRITQLTPFGAFGGSPGSPAPPAGAAQRSAQPLPALPPKIRLCRVAQSCEERWVPRAGNRLLQKLGSLQRGGRSSGAMNEVCHLSTYIVFLESQQLPIRWFSKDFCFHRFLSSLKFELRLFVSCASTGRSKNLGCFTIFEAKTVLNNGNYRRYLSRKRWKIWHFLFKYLW